MKRLKLGVKWLFVVASGTVLLAASPGARLCADDSKLPSKREPYVAEWVLTRNGKGKVLGGSADCPGRSALELHALTGIHRLPRRPRRTKASARR